MPTRARATASGRAFRSHCQPSPTPESLIPSALKKANSSIPKPSSETVARCIFSQPALGPGTVRRSSQLSLKTSLRPPAEWLLAPPAHGSIHRFCLRSTRSETSHRYPRCPHLWPKVAAPASQRCLCFNPLRRQGTNGQRTNRQRSGTPVLQRSSLAAPRTHATSKISPR